MAEIIDLRARGLVEWRAPREWTVVASVNGVGNISLLIVHFDSLVEHAARTIQTDRNVVLSADGDIPHAIAGAIMLAQERFNAPLDPNCLEIVGPVNVFPDLKDGDFHNWRATFRPENNV